MMKRVLSIALTLILLVGCALGASAAAFTPGVYEGTAKGNNGDVVVQVTVAEDAITVIAIMEHNETPGICDKAINEIPIAILEAQGLGVDTVSGATNTSKAIIDAVTDCLTQAGGDIAALKAIGSVKAEQAEDALLTADVIVIGAGGAGLAAAVQANQDGASVIVIEKQATTGGNTILSGGAFNAVRDGSPEAIETKDSVELHYEQTFNGGDQKGDPALVRTLVEGAYDGLEWLMGMGMEFQPGTFTVSGGLWPRAHKPAMPVGTGFIDTYQKYINGHDNIDLMLNTKAENLIVEGGKVTGVVATGETGNTVTLKANKAVVLATGGFGRNVEMRLANDTVWGVLDEKIPSTNHAGATGDGIAMAQEVGAALTGMEYIQLLPLGDPVTGSLSGNIELDVERRIFVNKNGERFVDEGGRRDDMTRALFAQPDSWMWIIVDSHCYVTGDEKNNFNESVNQLIAEGRAFKGETVAELAEAIGVPAANLQAALDDFNAHAATKEPDSFGRKLFSDPIDQGPFYAGARVPTVHHTMGGVKINTNAEVLTEDGSVVDGLYAAGEVTGGIHGTNRLGGNALADILVFGRIAGRNAAAK